MLIGQSRCFAPAWSASKKAFLDQEWFIYFFDRTAFLANSDGNGVQPDRPSAKLFDDREQDAFIHFIEAMLIDFERFQSHKRYFACISSISFNLGEIPRLV